jgi:hypothetical protein
MTDHKKQDNKPIEANDYGKAFVIINNEVKAVKVEKQPVRNEPPKVVVIQTENKQEQPKEEELSICELSKYRNY